MDYFLGLDLGTDSIGWAVTDTAYHIQKINQKALWGVRLFEPAVAAAERRSFRTARRRLERRKQRLAWLEQIFEESIAQCDPAFFQRLKESKFLEEDKQSDIPLGRYTLFADKDFCDKDYHRTYPTIYHLRQALLTKNDPFDVRLVYLAIHHILKNRGHFLFGNLNLEHITFTSCMDQLTDYLLENYEINLKSHDNSRLEEILTSRQWNTTQKKKQLMGFFQLDKSQFTEQAILELLSGATVNLGKIFIENPNVADMKLCLKDDWESKEADLSAALGDDIELLILIKAVFDWAVLANLRGGMEYISDAKVLSYEKHKKDLKHLQACMRLDKKLYYEMFRASKDKLDNYVAYSGHKAKNHRCSYDEFAKYIKKALKSLPESDETKVILDELDLGTFLPKQTTKENGVIPYQLHQLELEHILERASGYLPFLQEKDESGLTRKEQIISVFRFRIPYYVGPLNSASPHAWIERKEGKIFPWNFSEIVDLEASAEKFITRMTATCSYIGEDVLPSDSLLYSRFMILNELNKLKINGIPISVPLKQQIYRDLFLSGKKVSEKKLRAYLQSFGFLTPEDSLSGIDGDIKATLAPWRHFTFILQKHSDEMMVEDIIRHIVLYREDRRLLRHWLEKNYGNILSKEDQDAVCKYKYSGWGRLSRVFLTEIFHVDAQGEAHSIMDILWNTNNNLMELLSGRYGFADSVRKYRENKYGDKPQSLEDYLDESYASPPIKRTIRQTLAITDELVKVMKVPPKRIFVEVAREDGEKKRTVSRKKALQDLYKNCGKDAFELRERLESEDESNLRRDKLYLYYTQMGRCMYTGEVISLPDLDAEYDVDHIYPQSKTKDDSLNNRVLVKRKENANKGDTFPVSSEIRNSMYPFWSMLKSKNFITKEKFERLIRGTPFAEEELAGFIARQLVETRQSSKIVAELLQKRYGESVEVVYVKAGNVSAFRQDQRLSPDGQAGAVSKTIATTQDPLFAKCREINDFHHAKDAYLNIVVGNVYHLKFTKNPLNFLKKEKNNNYSLNRMFDFHVSRGPEVAWEPCVSITTVRNTMAKNNILFTRMSREVTGGYFDQQIVPKGKGQMPIKSSDPRMSIDKFGGYNKASGAYFCLVEHTEKKKRVLSIETVLLIHKTWYESDPISYCEQVLECKAPKILIPKIKIDALVSFDGFRMHISGRTGSQILYKNANQLILDPKWNIYVKKLGKFVQRRKQAGNNFTMTPYDGITHKENVTLYCVLLDKLRTKRYSAKLQTPAKTMADFQENFESLTVEAQTDILLQLLKITACNAASADLKALNGKVGIGTLLTSQNLINYKEHSFQLIHQSVTGLFENHIDLLAGGITS